MSRPALLVAILLLIVLVPSIVAALLDPGPSDVYELGAAPTSPDRLNSDFAQYVAAANDRTPPTAPPTTEARKSRHRTTVRAASIETAGAAGQVNGYPCGGDLPPCWVLQRESGGDPHAFNATGCGGRGCGGLWQFDPVTWSPDCTVAKWERGECRGYGGFARAEHAPADIQNARAREVWADGAGRSHWAA